ncbi:MAG: hypothetical protein J6P20_03375 [Oscillospiraceae bacterium]|nr:hypothetical protein [Oscillospiraceae bacterium]
MYRVIRFFTDLKDNGHAYNVGDVFPREGVAVTPERIKDLSTTRNARGIPLIAEEVKKPRKKTRSKSEG